VIYLSDEVLSDKNKTRGNRIQALHDILQVSIDPERTTKILRLANVRYGIYCEYVDDLLNAGLLKKKGKNEKRKKTYTTIHYQTTKIGDEWCKMIKSIYKELV